MIEGKRWKVGAWKTTSGLGGLFSLLLPGAGQVWRGEYRRGLSIFFLVGTALATTFWYKQAVWFAIPIALWLWNIWDAWRLPKGAPIAPAALLWLFMAYGIGWRVTEINPIALVQNRERGASILRPMLRPDFVTTREEVFQGWVDVEVPCSSQPPKAENTIEGIHLKVSPDCAGLGEQFFVTAEGLWPDYPTEITWQTPIGDMKLLGENFNQMLMVQSDGAGKLSAMAAVPPTALIAAPDPTLPLPHRVYLTQRRSVEGFAISTNGGYVFQGIYETLALALLATSLGAVLALPVGFLAARNLMVGHPLTAAIYVVVRTVLNVIRSVESLIFAIIFVIIVGLGPFPGMLALTIHTVAALGKLYSEVIEGIDAGPIEALRATGANWLQMVRYAVVPQIVPPFTALTIYRWDINVRSSTIVGFVGGGGIGFYLWQWIIIGDYRAVGASFIAIALVVMLMDFFSARLREKII